MADIFFLGRALAGKLILLFKVIYVDIKYKSKSIAALICGRMKLERYTNGSNGTKDLMNKRMARIIISLAASIVVLLFSLYGKYQTDIQQKMDYVRVVGVNDGDTITVLWAGKRERVRLIGIDAPELQQSPWGQRSKKYLSELLSASQWTVSLDFDLEKRDQYGRLLSYVWTSDKKMINLQMVKEGYAIIYTFPPNIRHVDEFRKAQDEARRKGLGIWGKGELKETPREYRKEHPLTHACR